MNISVVIAIVAPVLGCISLLQGVGIINPKRNNEKTEEEILKYRRGQKIIALVMFTLGTFYIFKVLAL